MKSPPATALKKQVPSSSKSNSARYLLFISCLFVAAHVQAEEPLWFVDSNYLYQKGSELSRSYLRQHAPQFDNKIKSITPWIVRIEIRHSITKSGFTTNHGTGTILKGGIVVTAKHTLTKKVKDLNGPNQIFLTTTDGRVLTAKVLQKGETDWMTLKIVTKDDTDPILRSPIIMSDPVNGETAVFLGYPARLGLDKHGNIKSFHRGAKKKNIPVSKLSPLLTIGKIDDASAVAITPVAGFPPVGGMSGGPIFNLRGEVIAVQYSISKTSFDATGEILSYRINAVPATIIKP